MSYTPIVEFYAQKVYSAAKLIDGTGRQDLMGDFIHKLRGGEIDNVRILDNFSFEFLMAIVHRAVELSQADRGS
jgi:hypothetical protein